MDILAMTQSKTQRPVAEDMGKIIIKHTGSLKVRSLNTAGALKALINQLSAYKVDIAALQEIQCTGSGILHPLLWL
jgi:hypothetical protein